MMASPTSGRAFVLLAAFLVLVASLVLLVVDPGAHRPERLGPWPTGSGDDVEVQP